MPKLSQINSDYVSLPDILVMASYYFTDSDSPFIGKIYDYLYPGELDRVDSIFHRISENCDNGKQLIGALQPLDDMWKDLTDAFKPHKSWTHSFKTLLRQPIRGIGNLFKGIIVLPLLAMGLPIVIGCCIYGVVTHQNTAAKAYAIFALSFFIDSLSSIIRGATQIVFTPLLPLKIALRGIIAAIKKSHQKIEDDRGVTKTVEKNTTPETNAVLKHKCQKAQTQGRTLPQGLDLTKPDPKNDYVITFFKTHKFMELIPAHLKWCFSMKRYASLPPKKRIEIMGALKNQEKSAEEILRENNLFNLAKITMMLSKKTESSFFANRSVDKHVLRIIAEYTDCEPFNPPAHLIPATLKLD